jgi:glycosyltransferase involved in cell wall biosynthesis
MSSKQDDRKRRVLIIVENLPVPFDRRVWAEATTLTRAGYDVSVICPKGHGCQRSAEIIEGVHIYRHSLPAETRGILSYFIEYPTALFFQLALSMRVALTRGFDVIHACNPPDLSFLIGLFYKLSARKRFLFDHHDANPELYEAKFKRRDWLWRLLVFLEKCTFRAADVTIAPNESYREIAMKRGGLPPDRIFVVRSGPEIARFKQCQPDPRWRSGRRFLAAYVGVIGESEGLDLLIESVAHIVSTRKRNDLQFVVVGSGPQWQTIVTMCENADLRQFVTFLGRVDDDTLFSVLCTSDICVNPDRVTAMNDISTMNKIMEYMVFGKPIVQFEVTEGRFSAQAASLYARPNDPIDFGDKILELIDDPARRDVMGQFGFTRVREQLAWDFEAPKLLAAYDALFEHARSGSPADPRGDMRTQ